MKDLPSIALVFQFDSLCWNTREKALSEIDCSFENKFSRTEVLDFFDSFR